MIEEVKVWEAEDASLHRSKIDALTHDTRLRLERCFNIENTELRNILIDEVMDKVLGLYGILTPIVAHLHEQQAEQKRQDEEPI